MYFIQKDDDDASVALFGVPIVWGPYYWGSLFVKHFEKNITLWSVMKTVVCFTPQVKQGADNKQTMYCNTEGIWCGRDKSKTHLSLDNAALPDMK